MKIPSIITLEADLLRRGIYFKEDGVPVNNEADLPAIVVASDGITSSYRNVFIKAIDLVRSDISERDLINGITSNMLSSVFDSFIRVSIYNHLYLETEKIFKSAFLEGSKAGAIQLRPLNIIVRQVEINFDLVNANAVQWASKNAGRLISNITEGQVRMVSDLVASSISLGMTPDEIARDIRRFIGLNSRRVIAVSKFRSRLIDQGLNESQVEKRTDRYAKASLASRATIISRSEILQAATFGQLGLWNIAADQGFLNKKKTKREWVATQDDLLDIHICEPMAGKTIKFDGRWTLPTGGQIDVPSESHPSCRCSENLIFDK